MDEEMSDEKFWQARKDFPDGRIALVVAQIVNAKLTVGRGLQTWDNAW